MAQNYNLNSSFGLNVTSNGSKTAPVVQHVDLMQQAANLLDPVNSYIDKYENVFSGEVEKEINMYSRQMMFVGMNMRASDNNIRRFDMNI